MLKYIPILFLICFCGDARGQQRIAGGQITTISQYPFAAALLTNGGSGTNYEHACGGTILTGNAVMSAASCFVTGGVTNPVSWWRVRTGSSYANSGGTVHIVSRITTHEAFSNTTFVNDIAVVRTLLTIALQPNLTAVARIAGAAYPFANNQLVWGIGWGVTSASATSGSEQLRVVQIWATSQQTCASRYAEAGFTVTNDMICAGWQDVGLRGQCEGDQGSPLLDASNVVVGVFSRAQACASSRYPAINTRVPSYTRWIVAAATS